MTMVVYWFTWACSISEKHLLPLDGAYLSKIEQIS